MGNEYNSTLSYVTTLSAHQSRCLLEVIVYEKKKGKQKNSQTEMIKPNFIGILPYRPIVNYHTTYY